MVIGRLNCFCRCAKVANVPSTYKSHTPNTPLTAHLETVLSKLDGINRDFFAIGKTKDIS